MEAHEKFGGTGGGSRWGGGRQWRAPGVTIQRAFSRPAAARQAAAPPPTGAGPVAYRRAHAAETANRASEERFDHIDYAIRVIDDGKVTPLIEGETRVRYVERDHVTHVKIVA